MAKIAVLLKKDIMEQIRAKKILILAIVFLFLAIASPLSAKLLPQLFKNIAVQGITINIPEPTYKDAIDQFVKNSSQLVIFILIFVVAGAVSDEKIKKTLEMVLVKPISRSSFILSKFLAYFLSISGLFMAGALIFYVYTISIFTSFNLANFLIIAILLLIYLLLIISVTMCASTVARSATMAGVIGLLGWFAFSSIIGVIPKVTDYAPSYFLSHYADVTTKGWNSNLLPPTIFSLILIVALIVLAIMLFSKQEIER